MKENYRYVTVCEDNSWAEALLNTTQLGEGRQRRRGGSAGMLQERGEIGESDGGVMAG